MLLRILSAVHNNLSLVHRWVLCSSMKQLLPDNQEAWIRSWVSKALESADGKSTKGTAEGAEQKQQRALGRASMAECNGQSTVGRV